MRGLKLLLVGLAGILFQLAVVGVVLSIIFLQILATPEPIKQSVQEPNIHQPIIDDIRTQIDRQTNLGSLIGTTELNQAIEESLPEEVFQAEIEQAVDASYEWLRGDADTLDFTLDFSDAQTTFTDSLGDKIVNQLADVPTCTSPAQFQPNTGIWDLACVPPGTNRNQLAETFVAESLASDNLLGDLTYSSDDLLAEADFDTQKIPKNFQRLEQSLLPIIVLATASTLAIIGFSVNKKKGMRRVGGQFVLAGGGLLIPGGLIWLFVRPELLMGGPFENATQEAVLSMLTILIRDALVISMIVGTILLLAGIMIRVIFKKPKKK